MTYLTYDDIQLVPGFSNIKSRQSIDLTTKLSKNYTISIPIVGSPMDTVCESDMAFKLYQLGGVGCIHRFNKIIEQYTEIQKLCEKISAAGEYLETIPIMAAIGVQEDDKQRAKNLIKAGANVLLIDVAHGDHQNVIDMTIWCKENLPSHVDIIAGNIATAEAAERLQEAGADGLRVGIGGGSLCTTRIKTGFGVPNVTCIEEISKVAEVPIMADGGIRSSGDIGVDGDVLRRHEQRDDDDLAEFWKGRLLGELVVAGPAAIPPPRLGAGRADTQRPWALVQQPHQNPVRDPVLLPAGDPRADPARPH